MQVISMPVSQMVRIPTPLIPAVKELSSLYRNNVPDLLDKLQVFIDALKGDSNVLSAPMTLEEKIAQVVDAKTAGAFAQRRRSRIANLNSVVAELALKIEQLSFDIDSRIEQSPKQLVELSSPGKPEQTERQLPPPGGNNLPTEDVVVAESDALSSASSEVISNTLSSASSEVISDVLSGTTDEHHPSGTHSDDIGFQPDESTPSHSSDSQSLSIDKVGRSLPPLGSPSQSEPAITDMSTGEAEGDNPSSEVVQYSNPDNPLNPVIPQNAADTSSKGVVDKTAIVDLTEIPEAAPETSVAPREELTAYQLSKILGVSDATASPLR